VLEATDEMVDLSGTDIGPGNRKGGLGSQSPQLPGEPQPGLLFFSLEELQGPAKQPAETENAI